MVKLLLKNPVHKASYYIHSSSTLHTIHTNLKRPEFSINSNIDRLALLKIEILICNKKGGGLLTILH